MRVCIVAEGCYPFVVGGVSSWIHSMIRLFPKTEFVILQLQRIAHFVESMRMNSQKMCQRYMNYICRM